MSRKLTKLFIKNFGQDTTSKEVGDLFGQYGEIFDLKINESAGFAVVVFKESEAAEKALAELNGSSELGGVLHIEYTYKPGGQEVDKGQDNRGQRDREFNNRGGFRDYNNRDQGNRGYSDRRSYNDRGGYERRGYNERGGYNDRGNYYEREGQSQRGNSGRDFGDRFRGERDYSERGQGGGANERSDYRGRQEGGAFKSGRFIPDHEKGEYMRNRLCFNCKGTGHISRDCPEGTKGRAGIEKGETLISFARYIKVSSSSNLIQVQEFIFSYHDLENIVK